VTNIKVPLGLGVDPCAETIVTRTVVTP
jgi:hypothetical protein